MERQSVSAPPDNQITKMRYLLIDRTKEDAP